MVYRAALLLVASNVFMTFAWYAHLQNMADRPWVSGEKRQSLGHESP